MTGIVLIIAFIAAIVLMVVAIAKFKVHPFLSIMGVSILLALVAGIPLAQIPDVIAAGFSGTFSSIGIVIILGALIGSILEQTGAALKLADMVVKLVGHRHHHKCRVDRFAIGKLRMFYKERIERAAAILHQRVYITLC